MYNIGKMPGSIDIGFTGETNFRKIEIDMTAWMNETPDGVPSIIHVRPGEADSDAYVAVTTFDSETNVLTWTITAADIGTREGEGDIQIWLEVAENDEITKRGKSKHVKSIVSKAVNNPDQTAPTSQEAFIEQVTALKVAAVGAKEDAEDAKEDAEAAAAEAQAAVTHPPYIDSTTLCWMVWNTTTGEYTNTEISATGDPTLIIDDEAGEGATDKTWSADKLDEELEDVKNEIDGIANAVTVSGTAIGAIATFDDCVANVPIKKLESSFSYTQEYGVPTPSNPIPIYGRTKDTIYHSGSDTSQATAIDVAWGNELGTVYRAKTFDAIQGSMLVDMVGVDLGSLTWTKQTGSAKDYFYTPISSLPYAPKYLSDQMPNAVCSVFSLIYQSASSWGVNSILFTAGAGTLPANVLAANVTKDAYADADAFKTAMSGQILVYEVTEPFTLEFTPVHINTLNGVNKFWNENGKEVEVTYISDTTSFVKKEVEEVAENTQGINQVINLYTEKGLVDGTINYDGTIWTNSDYVTTDYIEIPTKYNKNLNYIHAFDESGYARYIGFYDNNKQFISRAGNISGAVLVANGSKYVRIAYAVANTDRAVIFTNENTKPQYEPPQKYLQYDNDLNSFNKFVNSDGAVSAMITTGLMYLGDEQFGYGTEHTLFATSCVKSTKDTNTESSNYTGERYQLDCSAYAQIMLMGITPECSRYFGTKNIPSPNGYRFNRYVQYEGYVYNVLQEGNTKRLYANAIAEYAYKNGYLFLIDDGFTNIRPGDILFWSNQPSSYHFFEDIGHCGVVVDVVPMEDGSNTVVTFEGKGGSGSPCQFQSYTSRASAMVYAARFPMPYVHDDAEDIASFNSTVTTAVSGSSGSVVDIATVQTTKTLEAGKMYTVLIKCELPDNCYVQIKTNGMSHIGIANDDVLKRPDGYYVFRIFSKKSDTLTETGSITVQAHCTGSVSDNAVLSKMKVYEGFVTPIFD